MAEDELTAAAAMPEPSVEEPPPAGGAPALEAPSAPQVGEAAVPSDGAVPVSEAAPAELSAPVVEAPAEQAAPVAEGAAVASQPEVGEKRPREEEPPLPPGWIEAKHPGYNDATYWYHSVTKETSWTRPTGPPKAPPVDEIPGGMDSSVDMILDEACKHPPYSGRREKRD